MIVAVIDFQWNTLNFEKTGIPDLLEYIQGVTLENIYAIIIGLFRIVAHLHSHEHVLNDEVYLRLRSLNVVR